MNKEKLKEVSLMLFYKIAYYLSNIIILAFFVNAFKEESLPNLLALSLSLLGVIGALSALCYSSSASQINKDEKLIYRKSGDRFLHSFMSLIMALLFSGLIISINANGFLNIKNDILTTIINIIVGIFAFIYTFKAARSYSVGFHMVFQILNEKFKLQDEKLYDDLNEE